MRVITAYVLETQRHRLPSQPVQIGEAGYSALALRLFGRDQMRIALAPSSAGISAALRARGRAGSSRLTERNSRPASLLRFQAAPSSTGPGWPSTVTR